MAQKLRIKNGLHLCALSALCLVTLHRASATSPMRPNDQEVEKEIDIVGRSASIVKDFSLPGYDGGDSTPEPSCISKKDGITRPSLNNDAFNRCEKRHEQCSITGIR
ncbi:MAG: hypothetical protein ABIR96_01805, partial [Bdellovibrionota bacterium]